MTLLTAQQLNTTNPYAMPDELEAVRDLSRLLGKANNIVMIGAGPGVFALAAMEEHPAMNSPALSVVEIGTFDWIGKHLEAAGVLASNITFIQGDSGEIGKDWQGETDLLIIDGDHSEAGVGRDLDAWWDKVKVGGAVFMHDYLEREGGFDGVGEWKEEGVAKAWKAYARNCDHHVIAQPGISFVVGKLSE